MIISFRVVGSQSGLFIVVVAERRHIRLSKVQSSPISVAFSFGFLISIPPSTSRSNYTHTNGFSVTAITPSQSPVAEGGHKDFRNRLVFVEQDQTVPLLLLAPEFERSPALIFYVARKFGYGTRNQVS